MNKIIALFLFCSISTRPFCQPLQDGEYFIKINDTGKYLAIAGAANNNGGLLIQWDNEYKQHFMFILKHLGNNVYTLRAKHSGKYLSTEGAPAAGAKIIQWDWMNQDNQKWNIVQQKGSGSYIMSCVQNNMRMVMQYWNSYVTPQNGAYMFLSGDPNMRGMALTFKRNETENTNGNLSQMSGPKQESFFTKVSGTATNKLANIADGIYKIRINETGKYLAIAGQEDHNNGMRLIQWEMLPRNNHLFEIKKEPDGKYSIKAVHSKKVLDVVDQRTDDGTQVQQWDDLKGGNQRWSFYNMPTGVSIVSVASGKALGLSAGNNNSSDGIPLMIKAGAEQSFTLIPARALQFTEYITLKNLKFAVPHGGDLDMFGRISVYLVDRNGNSFNRYYASEHNKFPGTDNLFFNVDESLAFDMDKRRSVNLKGEVKLKISGEELPGAKIIIIYGINENDADVASLFSNFGAAGGYDPNPDAMRVISLDSYRAGGSDDFYMIRNSFGDCLKSRIARDGRCIQEFFVSDIPANCQVHVNLQDEDGSDNWLDIYFTVSKERKL